MGLEFSSNPNHSVIFREKGAGKDSTHPWANREQWDKHPWEMGRCGGKKGACTARTAFCKCNRAPKVALTVSQQDVFVLKREKWSLRMKQWR